MIPIAYRRLLQDRTDPPAPDRPRRVVAGRWPEHRHDRLAGGPHRTRQRRRPVRRPRSRRVHAARGDRRGGLRPPPARPLGAGDAARPLRAAKRLPRWDRAPVRGRRTGSPALRDPAGRLVADDWRGARPVSTRCSPSSAGPEGRLPSTRSRAPRCRSPPSSGPLLAGLLLGWVSPGLLLALDAASFACLGVVAWRAGAATEVVEQPIDAQAAESGFRLLRRPDLLSLTLVTWVFFFLYGPVEVALPVYVAVDLQGPPGCSARTGRPSASAPWRPP